MSELEKEVKKLSGNSPYFALPSFHLKAEDFIPADEDEKQGLIIMRESVNFWKDSFRRLKRNPLAMISFWIIVAIFIISFIVPAFYPYTYKEQIRGSENLGVMEYSESELLRIEEGEKVFPHLLGTDNLGRDLAVRIMIGSRISLIVGIVSSLIILVIGSVYGCIAGYFGGTVDMIMMRIVDLIYSVPDILIIILLSVTLRHPLRSLAQNIPQFDWINTVGVGLICIFIVFALLYWVGMARIVRSQILTIKELEYVTAAKAIGQNNRTIIFRHLLTNCIGTLIATTTLQIPSAIFTESFLSFIGMGVSAPLPSLGSLATDALSGIYSYPMRLFAPSILLSLIILAFNLFGDGLRDAFDPKLKD